MKFVTQNIAVEVKLRPVNPANLVKRPQVVLKDKNGNDVRTIMRPKVVIGVNQQDGRTVYGYPLLMCPKCHGKGKYTTVVVINNETNETYTMPKALYEAQIPRFSDNVWSVQEEAKEQECDLCLGEKTIPYFTNYEKVLTADGKPIGRDEAVPYAIQEDGKLEQFPYFPRSDSLSVQLEIPKTKATTYYFDGGWAELDSPTKTRKIQGEKVKVHDEAVEQLLWKEAERYIAENIIGIGRFVKSESHKEWFFVAIPTVNDKNQFGWLIGYTTCKLIQKCLMRVPSKTKIAQEVKVPTKHYLDMEAFTK